MHHILRNIIVVPDSLISHIINSNLEVRTSVSIDPLTGAAKERALFTSEAIPRGTVFYGDLRLFEGLREDIPSIGDINRAFKDSKKYYETLGVGGMVTRGFGRLKVYLR
jgi:CRISPR-associated protein Cmr4